MDGPLVKGYITLPSFLCLSALISNQIAPVKSMLKVKTQIFGVNYYKLRRQEDESYGSVLTNFSLEKLNMLCGH